MLGAALIQLKEGCPYLFHSALKETVEQWTRRGHEAPTTLWRGGGIDSKCSSTEIICSYE